MSGWSRLWLGCLVAGVVAAGCGSGSGSGSDRAASDGDRSAAREPAAERTTTTTTPTTSTLPRAADGTNIAACADGNCEVELSRPVDIPLTGQGGLTTLSVVEVTSDGLSFRTTSPEGSTGSGSLSGACTATFYSGGQSSMCTTGQDPPPAPREPGVLVMQVIGAADDAIVIRLVS